MDTDQILHVRLDNDERQLKRCLQTFTTWAASVTNKSSSEHQLASQLIVAELKQYSQSLAQHRQLESVAQSEIETFHRSYQDIEHQIEATKKAISDLRQERIDALEERTRMVKYDQIAREVARHPDCRITQADIDRIQQDMATLSTQKTQRQNALLALRPQFDTAMAELQRLTDMVELIHAEDHPPTTQTPNPAQVQAPASTSTTTITPTPAMSLAQLTASPGFPAASPLLPAASNNHSVTPQLPGPSDMTLDTNQEAGELSESAPMEGAATHSTELMEDVDDEEEGAIVESGNAMDTS
ncbi:hypothetical protein H4R33_004990 [Dimargaris cristalligena]|nr:hypothetical protein H4R33_004990 [Dimargaris cristalligena]